MIEISTDKNKLDIEFIHSFLTESYWAKGRSVEEIKISIENSLNFGVYLDKKQIGFGRVLTDYVVFAYLMDIFILPEYRGRGYAKQLISTIIKEPKLQNCKGWLLKTRDAHGLYEQFDFKQVRHPNQIMERYIE